MLKTGSAKQLSEGELKGHRYKNINLIIFIQKFTASTFYTV
jgi:hypothetical protein